VSPAVGRKLAIHKRDHLGQEITQYSGVVLAEGQTWLILEAQFNIPGEQDAGYTVFRFNDRFVERYFTDRWYSIWEMHDVSDDRLKGWYCNICRPVTITETDVIYDDLALDVWVARDGTIQVLDEDEFGALNLDAESHAQALAAVSQIRALVEGRVAPFDQIGNLSSPR